MSSHLRIWLVFAAALAVLLGVMGWVSWTVIRLDDAQAAARAQAELEEASRLALWRMDASLPALILQENARPFARPATESPRAEHIRSHFTVDARQGVLSLPSPPAWVGQASLDLPESQPAPRGEPASRPAPKPADGYALRVGDLLAVLPDVQEQLGPVELASLGGKAAGRSDGQAMRNMDEMRARTAFAQNTINQMQSQTIAGPEARRVQQGAIRAVWMDGHLLLARRVSADGKLYVQGGWVDWPALRASLLESIRDLLPQAALEPARPGDAERGERVLATLPVKLTPGPVPGPPRAASPLRASLLIAWACLLVAAGAVAALLAGALALSRRRGDFVSSVTHELRTPLTTFRMYTEMLRDGIVEPEKRQGYLDTLHAESNRLTHLVENVLTYSRLERKAPAGQCEVVPLRRIMDSCEARLRDRCTLASRSWQAGMVLVVEIEPGVEGLSVLADPWAVELILFNLVDNACKYASTADDRRIHLEVVRDHGPGIGADDARRVFKAFARLSQEMAGGKQGVGLGLAICRRLATNMGGQFVLENPGQAGASFILALPIAPNPPLSPA